MDNTLTAPTDLSDVAREKWNELAPQLADRCKDIPADLLSDLLRQYCEAHALRALAMNELRAAGSILATANNGTRYPAPQLKVIDQCEKTLDRVFRRLGFGSKRADDAEFVLDL